MAHRFCPRCNAEVEDAGGYCLLGHDLRLAAPVDSLQALRAEVNRTFDEARRELADVMAPPSTAAREAAATGEPPPPPPRPAARNLVRLDEALVVEGHPEHGREWADEPAAPSSNEATAVASPSPVRAEHSLWQGLDEAETVSPGDPIETFAPSPRMDWGPRRTRFGRRRAAEEQPADAWR